MLVETKARVGVFAIALGALFTIFQDFFWTVPCVGSEVTVNKFDIFIICTIKGILVTIYSNVCVCAIS